MMESEIKLREKLKQIQREYEKKQRKLKKYQRAKKAKEHVKKTLRKQASLCNSETNCQPDVKNNCKSENSDSKEDGVFSKSHLPSSNKCQKSQVDIQSRKDTETSVDELNKSLKNIEVEVQHTDVKDKGAEFEVIGTTLNSPDTGKLDSVCASQNSCSQDIFSSPKNAARNLFEDIHRSVLNRNESDLDDDNKISSELTRHDNSLAYTCLTSSGRNRNTHKTIGKENEEPALLHSGADHDKMLSVGSCNIGTDTRESSNKLKLAKMCNSKGDMKADPQESKPNDSRKYENTMQYHVTENTSSVTESCLADPEVDEFGKDISVSKSGLRRNSFRKNSGKSSGSVNGELDQRMVDNDNIVMLNSNIGSTESVLGVSETPTDSDWTIPGSSDDFVHVKSKSRKRKSKTQGKRRQSLRIAELSSQESQSQSVSEHVLPMFNLQQTGQTIKVKHRNKVLAISSIFQYLVDEAKREPSDKDFSLPYKLYKNLNDAKFDINTQAECNSPYSKNTKTEDLNCKATDSVDFTSVTCSPNQSGNFELVKITSGSDVTDYNLKNVKCDQISSIGLSENLHLVEGGGFKCVTDETNEIDASQNQIHSCTVTASPNKVVTCPSAEESSILREPCMSPPLFESQTDTLVTKPKTDVVEMFASPKPSVRAISIGSKASPAGVAVLPEDEVVNRPEYGVMEQTATFAIPKTDQLISVVMGEVAGEMNIVCLCSTSLQFYQLQDNKWCCCYTEKLNFSVKKNSGCSISWVPDNSRVCVLLQQRRTDSVIMMLYIMSDTGVKTLQVDALWSRSVLVCPVLKGEFITSHMSDQKTHLTKYSTNQNDVSRHNLEPIFDQLTSLTTVKHIEEAVLGLSNRAQLYIWNHCQMSLLTTVDVSDVSPLDSVCSQAFLEQGFLFLAVFSRRRCKQAGSVLVVNPQMGTCETLTALQTTNLKWTGCSSCLMLQDEYIVVRENCGSLLIWDMYTGELVISGKEISASCVSTTASGLAIGHKQCIHVYKTVSGVKA